MSSSIRIFLLALIGACASTVLASAQAASSPTDVSNSAQAPSSPVAYVYVSNYLSSSNVNQIDGYSAASNGALTPIPGSPYPYNVNYMALTGSWLFGIANMDEDLDSFSIGSNGALTLKNSLTVVTNGNGLISDYLDHTGATLYADLYSINNDYLSYSIDKSTGQLTQVGDLAGGPSNGSPVSFIGNDVFAYSSSCYHFTPEIVGVQRNTDGTLSYLNNFNPPLPATKTPGFYCPEFAAADPTNHVAVAMQPLDSNWQTVGPYQLATYTADSTGNLTTTSTYSNMSTTEVAGSWGITDYRMSPSGKFLAVAGNLGLQIFHFNGANPITRFTKLLATSPVDQVLWDNAHHLYAISYSASKLWVFTVTSTGVTQAPGSPHSITSPQNLIVLPKT